MPDRSTRVSGPGKLNGRAWQVLQRFTWGDVAVLVAAAVVELAITWPLALHLTTHVYGYPSDNFEYVWRLWWFQHAVFDLHTSPFVVPTLFYPHTYLMAYSEITPLHTVLLLPLTRLCGAVTVYNGVLLLSGPLTAWIVYRFVLRGLRRTQYTPSAQMIGAGFAAVAYTFSSYRLVRYSIGHLNLVGTQWLVLAFYGLDRWLESRRPKDALLLAVGISLTALSSWYYALLLLIALPVYALAYDPHLRAWLTDRRNWIALGIVAVVVGVTVIPFTLPYRDVLSSGDNAISEAESVFWSAKLINYLSPGLAFHAWKNWVTAHLWPGLEPFTEHDVTVGWLPLLFGLIGFFRLKGAHWRALKAMIVVALVFSLGPRLTLVDHPTGITLPVDWLHGLPLVSGMRVWSRCSTLVTFGLSVLGGTVLAGWLSGRGRITRLIAAAVIFGLLGVFMLPLRYPISDTGPRPVDTWLAEQPGDFVIMQYPLIDALSGYAELYTRYHGKKVLFGYGTYFTKVFHDAYPELSSFPDDAALDTLHAVGVKYVLIQLSSLNSPSTFSLAAVDAQPRLRYVVTLGDQAVYAVLR